MEVIKITYNFKIKPLLLLIVCICFLVSASCIYAADNDTVEADDVSTIVDEADSSPTLCMLGQTFQNTSYLKTADSVDHGSNSSGETNFEHKLDSSNHQSDFNLNEKTHQNNPLSDYKIFNNNLNYSAIPHDLGIKDDNLRADSGLTQGLNEDKYSDHDVINGNIHSSEGIVKHNDFASSNYYANQIYTVSFPVILNSRNNPEDYETQRKEEYLRNISSGDIIPDVTEFEEITDFNITGLNLTQFASVDLDLGDLYSQDLDIKDYNLEFYMFSNPDIIINKADIILLDNNLQNLNTLLFKTNFNHCLTIDEGNFYPISAFYNFSVNGDNYDHPLSIFAKELFRIDFDSNFSEEKRLM